MATFGVDEGTSRPHISTEDIADHLAKWASSGVPLLDVRSADRFAELRLKGPVCHIAWPDLHDEAFSLPPRESPFAMLVSCCAGGCPEGRPPEGLVRFSDFAAGRAATTPSCWSLVASFSSARSPWPLAHVFLDCDELWAAASARGLAESGPPGPSCRLWVPTPTLEQLVCKVEAALGGTADRKLSCLDLGSGSGRDTSFLALRGWFVVAVDNMQAALNRAKLLAVKSGVGDFVRTERIDVKRYPDRLRAVAAERGFDLLLVSRFFHRPLLRVLPDLVRPGGLVLYWHFRDGVQHHEIGHPSSPDDFLQNGELRETFAGWDALLEDEHACLPDGRPMATFLAQRPSNSGASTKS